MGKGYLEIYLYAGDHALPVEGATAFVRNLNGEVLYELVSDRNGNMERVPLDAPNVSEDMIVPDFAKYDVEIPPYKGFKKVVVHDVQIFDGETTILPVMMHPAVSGDPQGDTDDIYIPGGRAVEECRQRSDRAAISEPEVDRMVERILANEVRIPNYITVHLGSPNNSSAQNVRVPFKDYLKNVASREVFPTWKQAALEANILAQMTFAINRVYTAHYRSQFKDFDITNSTAFDQAFDPSKSTFEVMSKIVDNLFSSFLRRQGRREPFFSSYCNGTTATCDGLYQCGAQELALRGYSTMQILHYYYPKDLQIVESNNFSSEIGTYPGRALKEGDSGEEVRRMQMYLNRLSGNWWITPIQNPNGFFGADTKRTVMEFQERVARGTPDGIIGKNTWYNITAFYVAAKGLSELYSEGERLTIGATPPTSVLRLTSPPQRGEDVVELQFLLVFISQFFESIPTVIQNGVFNDNTKRGVIEFQKTFGLTPDGIVGPSTWRKLYDIYKDLQGIVTVPTHQFPGTPLKMGSQGNSVLLMQTYLNAISKAYPSIPSLTADGSFGPATYASVVAFQRQFGLAADGIIGEMTWYKIIDVYNNLPSGQVPPFPGTNLRIGSRGENVRIMQSYLNAISKIFPSIPSLTADGVFGSGTEASVRAFQSLFGLSADGIIGRETWNRIVSVYNNLPDIAVPKYPGTPLRVGSRGNDVIIMQKYLNTIAQQYTSIPTLSADGIFGSGTESSVIAFQRQFGLTQDGVIGNVTWNTIVSVYNRIIMNRSRVESVSVSSFENSKGGLKPLAVMMALRSFRGMF